MTTAIWHGKEIAKSDRTQEIDGYIYFPRESVRMDLLQATPKTANDLKCPHGVQFYDVVDGAKASLALVPQAISTRDADLLHRILIELRSYENLLDFRFG